MTQDHRLLVEVMRTIDDDLADDDAAFAHAYPGEATDRQPVHTCYVPADRATTATPADWGTGALALLDRVGAPPGSGDVIDRVRAKLAGQPVEDLRLDLEDGYGWRSDDVEDADARAAGRLLAALDGDPHGPLVAGLRIKGVQPGTRSRGIRSLVLAVEAAAAVDAAWPRRTCVVVLPKATSPAQVSAMCRTLGTLERAAGLPAGSLLLEIQVELPQALVAPDGRVMIAPMLQAAERRCLGLHFGTYDFSAAAGVSGGRQASDHPLADHAKALMQLAAAGTGVRVVDGSTNVLPVGGADDVRAAWAEHARLVRRALGRALYQGWDLHPGQLVTRYVETYTFLRAELAIAGSRLRGYLDTAGDRSPWDTPATQGATPASAAGGSGAGILDEPATAQALAGAVLRGVDCGAVDLDEASAVTGVTRVDLIRLAGR